ncbi:MAG: YdeI/OmpD-associated family protein [Flavihumibacter sp.]|nr:YdeI/OmpD-associated family protein [Flavihumibacter sp.]
MAKAVQAPEEFYAKDRKAWRRWLLKNHAVKENCWLIIYKKESSTPSVYYDEAVEEALCFGWIDSKPNKRDAESFLLFFSKRKPKSVWSALNKQRIAKLEAAGLLMPAGIAMVELAKKTGTWTALDAVDALEYPADIMKAFQKNKTAAANFEAFPKSTKQGILQWILSAKKEETRNQRIAETVSLAAKNIRANQWKPK